MFLKVILGVVKVKSGARSCQKSGQRRSSGYLHDGMILAEAQRIVAGLKDLSGPNSPNKTHFMVELSPYFVQIASSKDTDRLFSMLPYKSLCFTGMKDRHGLYAVIGRDENRDKEVRRPRASIRRQLSESKQAQAPKKPPARTKKNELEV